MVVLPKESLISIDSTCTTDPTSVSKGTIIQSLLYIIVYWRMTDEARAVVSSFRQSLNWTRRFSNSHRRRFGAAAKVAGMGMAVRVTGVMGFMLYAFSTSNEYQERRPE